MSDTTQSSIENLTVSAPPVADEHTTHAAAPDQRPSKPRTRRGVWWYTWRLFAVVIGWVIVSFVWLWAEGPVELIVSAETTVITEPIGEDGLVDYVAWLDRDAKVPPERNAAIVFNAMMATGAKAGQFGGVTDALVDLRADRWYDPWTQKPGTVGMMNRLPPDLSFEPLVKLGELAAKEARHDFAEGKPRIGFKRMEGLLRVGRAIPVKAFGSVDYLKGRFCEQFAWDVIKDGLRAGQFSSADLQWMQKRIASLLPYPSPRYMILHGERFFQLDVMQRLCTAPDEVKSDGPRVLGPFSKYCDFNQMLRCFNTYDERMVEAAEGGRPFDGPAYIQRYYGVTSQDTDYLKVKLYFLPPSQRRREVTDYLTGMLLNISCKVPHGMWQTQQESVADQRLMEAGVALELYRKRHGGKLPETLAAGLGVQGKPLLFAPKNKRFHGQMRLTVMGDKAAPDAYALWFPRTLWEWSQKKNRYVPVRINGDVVIENDPLDMKAKKLQSNEFSLYIPISANAKAAWKAAERKKEEEPSSTVKRRVARPAIAL